MTAPVPRGLYAIADTATIGDDRLSGAVEAALAGGARMVQYRDKRRDGARRLEQARVLVEQCHRHRVPAIVNDDLELALDAGADGLHVGRDDADPARIRARAGAGFLVGVSCYADIGRAHRARAAGADYVAFGSVYPSPTKPDAVGAPLALLARARAETGLPVCAIGGITAERAPELVAAGADLLAVIDDLFGRPDHADVERRAAAYARAFAPDRHG